MIARIGVVVVLLTLCAVAQPPGLRYTVTLEDAEQGMLRVDVYGRSQTANPEFRLPVWNALYQVRDFATNVIEVAASSGNSNLRVEKFEKSAWRLPGVALGTPFRLTYSVRAQMPGVFGAEFNREHAFLNLAMVLMYPAVRDVPIEIHFANLPAGWKIATSLPRDQNSALPNSFTAPGYDYLVDSPVEMSALWEENFEDCTLYRVAVHANPADYDGKQLLARVRSVAAAGAWWMNECPFDVYSFLYHFPATGGLAGMEHAYSTAIQVPAVLARQNGLDLASITAHEFFHSWNAKRIRPATLAPVDHSRENYTRSLWFMEGVTSTAADLILMRAKLLDEAEYLSRISGEITELESRPARKRQSAAEASVDAWLERWPDYRDPQRSISYYNKGNVLGVLLDLAMREATAGKKGLRELFLHMNEEFAKAERPYDDASGIREAVEAVTGKDFQDFFDSYVEGVEPLPYNIFASVGLRLVERKQVATDLGFSLASNFDGPTAITAVEPRGPAATAGVRARDVIVAVNGRRIQSNAGAVLSRIQPGQLVKMELRTARGERRTAQFKAGSRQTVSYALAEAPTLTEAQRRRRRAWMNSDVEASARAVAAQ